MIMYKKNVNFKRNQNEVYDQWVTSKTKFPVQVIKFHYNKHFWTGKKTFHQVCYQIIFQKKATEMLPVMTAINQPWLRVINTISSITNTKVLIINLCKDIS